MMPMLPRDHPERLALAAEVHARPPEPLSAPASASHIAVLLAPEERAAERLHLVELCRSLGQPEPAADATQVVVAAHDLRVKWERHGEFSGWTCLVDGPTATALDAADPFGRTAAAALPAGWLAALPGRTVTAVHAALLPVQALGGNDAPSAATFARWFPDCDGVVVGSAIADGAGRAYTDFRVQADGWSRIVLLHESFTPRQAGRMLQRLFEIEVYRVLALLALPTARAVLATLGRQEAALAQLTAGIAREGGEEEHLLHELTELAAGVERQLAESQFRFGACRAYSALVATRIEELREQRLPGLQTVAEFMARRFSPAVATCATASQRLHELAERVAQASSLLATRVGIARERQNQALLASMDKRAKLQLRLQQTVEGLSVAAIAYYAAGLVGYLAKGAKAAGLKLDPDLAVGLALPVLAALVALAVQRARRHLHEH